MELFREFRCGPLHGEWRAVDEDLDLIIVRVCEDEAVVYSVCPFGYAHFCFTFQWTPDLEYIQ